MIATPKGTSLRGTVLWHILRQNRSRGLIGCSELQEPPPQNGKKTNTFWRAKSRMRGNETPAGRIVTNFCTGVGVYDVITSANFYDCRLWGLSVVGGGQIWAFSIDLRRRPYNTLALPCECVICSQCSMRLQDWCITVVNITTSARLVGRSGTAFRLLAEFWGSVPPANV